jgi:lipooligosaccharide transport system permease protein
MSASPLQPANLCAPVRLRTGLAWSLFGVWYRHVRVYCKTFLANATPAVLEPLFFFTAVALGLGSYMPQARFEGLPYATYVASGVLAGSAMFTAVFETTYGTFVRLVYQHSYDAMLGTHLRTSEMFTGEMLFCASKGAVFSTIVVLVTFCFGVRPTAWCVLVPVVGAVTGYLWAAIGLIVTSYVKMINNFSFFTTGVITPVFFFSGTFFPIRGHYAVLDVISMLVPLTPSIELSRALFKADFTPATLMNAGILLFYLVLFHVVALRRMTKRVLRGASR